MSNNGFLKLNRCELVLEMLHNRPTAYNLLTLIAWRARRKSDRHLDELKLNQAYIGDYESYGVTERIYRTDKLFLEKYGFATFKGSNKGTVATLCDNSIFDINVDGIKTTQRTDERRASDEQATTNKNERMKEIKNMYICEEELLEIANKFSISLKDTKSTYENMLDWLKSKGRTYNDHKAGLRNWVRKSITEGTIKVIQPEAELDPLVAASMKWRKG